MIPVPAAGTAAPMHESLLESVVITCVVSCVIALLGLIFFQFAWLNSEYVKIPKLDKEKRQFLPPSNDFTVNNVFSLYWNIAKILFGPTAPLIERYGFEQTYYFKLRNFFILPLSISIIAMSVTIYIFGSGFDSSWHLIWRRFTGYNDDHNLSQSYVSIALLICITLPLQLTCWYSAYRMQKDLQTYFDYSESTNGETKFWYHIRSSMIDYCHRDDIPGVKTYEFLEENLEKLKLNDEIRETIGESKIEKALVIPDLAKLAKYEHRIFYTKAAFDEGLENCQYCCRPCGLCCCPSSVYNYDKFSDKMLKLEEGVDKVQSGKPFQGSTFAFFACTSVKTNYQMTVELNWQTEEFKECLDKCFCHACSSMFPKKFQINKKKAEEEQKALLDEEEDGENAQEDVEQNQTTDEQKIEESKDIVTKKDNQETKSKMPTNSHCCSKRDKNAEANVTTVAKVKKDALKPDKYSMECNNVVDPENTLWYNIGGTVQQTWFEKLIYVLIIAVMFIFLSTPAAFLQLFKRAKFINDFLNGAWTKGLGPVGPFIKTYLTTGVTLLCNKIFLAVALILARSARYPNKSDYHRNISNVSYLYYTQNMVIMPGLTLAGGKSIFALLNNEHMDFKKIMESFKLIDHGSFFINMIFQSVGIGFLIASLRLYDQFVLGFGNFGLTNSIRQLISEEMWLQKEQTLLQYGTNMAYFCTIVTLCCVFGYMSPQILVPCIIYIIFRNLSDCNLMVCFNKKETEEYGRLATFGIKRVMTGVMIGHFILLFISYFHKKPYAFWINLFYIIACIVFDIFLYRKLARINSMEFLEYKETDLNKPWTQTQKDRWLELYTHPLFKSRPEIIEKMQEAANKKHLANHEDNDLPRLNAYLDQVVRLKDKTLYM